MDNLLEKEVVYFAHCPYYEEMMKKINITVLVFSFFVSGFLRGADAAVVSSILVDLANQDRLANNAPPLILNSLLSQAAQIKADDMASKSYFAHTSPDGISPWYWLEDTDYDFVYAGENLAMNYSDSKELEKAWMDSPKHRENILNPHFTEIGIASAKGLYHGQEVTFVVQMFGGPAFANEQKVSYIFIGLKPFNIALNV